MPNITGNRKEDSHEKTYRHQRTRTYAAGEMEGILDITMDKVVSSDILCNLHSSIIVGLSTSVVGERMVKVLAWYDNEYGYSQRLLELADFVASKMKA